MKNKDTEVKRMLHTPAGLHVREAAEGEAPSRTIVGYAILFGVPSVPLWQDDDSEAVELISNEAVTKEFLDTQDIKMTMFHDRQLILARSNKGKGTLTYTVDDKGVKFEFEAPNTADGDKALELVKRGDITGCSFMFSTHYYDRDFVERTSVNNNGNVQITYKVKAMTGIYDFTLAADPAYPDTSVEARDLVNELRDQPKHDRESKENEEIREQVAEMRKAASLKFIV